MEVKAKVVEKVKDVGQVKDAAWVQVQAEGRRRWALLR